MQEIFPIFVPSKGRAENAKTIDHLVSNNAHFTIVLEKEDFESYQKKYPAEGNTSYMVLPESNKGIAYARNQILENCRALGIEWYWMLDDDITGFYHRDGKKMVKDDYTVLAKAQEIFLALPNIGQAALEYQQLAWSADKDYRLNSYQDVCVCINSKLTGDIKYREYVNLKEDRDFTMQIIHNKKDVCRITLYAFSAPKNGSNKGGLKEVYDTNGREEQASKRMIELWGSRICQLNIKEDGRPDVKIIWKEIRLDELKKQQMDLF